MDSMNSYIATNPVAGRAAGGLSPRTALSHAASPELVEWVEWVEVQIAERAGGEKRWREGERARPTHSSEAAKPQGAAVSKPPVQNSCEAALFSFLVRKLWNQTI